jgi:hypothetical protein
MIAIETELTSVPATTAVLLTYAAGLSHFEREILPSLLSAGERSEVLLLVDGHQLQETFSEVSAINGPGVEYRLQGIHLSQVRASFHPKLYILLAEEEISAWIASANLTLFGCRVNAEIVERLQLGPEGGGSDRSAWQDVASFLDAIPGLEPGLKGVPAKILAKVAGEIRRRSDSVSDSPLRVLHNAHESLLAQLSRLIPPETIDSVYVVTPFFDPDGTALRALARAYTPATLHVITGPNAAGTLDGSCVAGWEVPPTLKIYHELAGESRRPLHAKLYLFVGRHGAWTLTGSPNLSDAAWVLPASRGNLECALLRFWPDAQAALALLEPLECVAGAWGDLQLRTDSESKVAGEDDVAPLPIGTIERVGESLQIHFGPAVLSAGDTVQVRLELRSGVVERSCGVRQTPNGAWLATAELRLPEETPLPDHPVIATVRVTGAERRVREGRAWLTRPDLLDRSNWQRRAAALAASYAGTMADDEAVAFADLLLQVSAELALAQALDGHSGSRRRGGAEGLDGPETEASVDTEDLVRAGEHRVGSDGLSGPSRRVLEQIFQALAYWEPSDETDPWESDEQGGEDRPERGEPSSRHPAPYGRTTLRKLERSFQESLNHWTRTPPKPGNVVDLVRMLNVRTRGLVDLVLRSLQAQDTSGAKMLAQALLASLREAFSLDGVAEGHPAGWMVRAWAEEPTREPVRDALRSAYPALLAHLGALHALAGFLELTVPGGIALLLGGLKVAAERSRVLEEADAEGALTREIDRLVHRSDGLLTETEIQAVLQAADGEIRSTPVIRAARWWAPVFPGEHYRSAPGAPAAVQGLLRKLAAGRKVPVTGFTATAAGTFCNCGVRISEQKRQDIERDTGVVEQCDTCHAYLVPFALRNEITRRVLSAFLADLLEDR